MDRFMFHLIVPRNSLRFSFLKNEELVTLLRLLKINRVEYLTVRMQEKKIRIIHIRLRTLPIRFSKMRSLLANPAKKGNPARERLLITMLTVAILALIIFFLIRR
jgi:hypothetical protein